MQVVNSELIIIMLERVSDKNFFVVKFVGLPRVFGRFPYMCIHNSWIVTSTGKNVMVACPLQDVVSISTYGSVVFEVYSATVEYETGQYLFFLRRRELFIRRRLLIFLVGIIADDVDDGMRFLRCKMSEYAQELLATDFNKTTSILRRLLLTLPSH